jgi:hypothetical protein
MENRTTPGKALKINLDPQRYGAFAEIGAGQEVARHFFTAGLAAQTIAKSMSAYDMVYSDEIYGKEKSGRYVVESRLMKMLDKEYALLQRRLAAQRGDKTSFFAFANTVATGSPETPRCHGWMGVQFQTKPHAEPNTVILHVRMLDRMRLQQQQALGILGVNLLEACFYQLKDPSKFIDNLVEGLKNNQMVIDVLKFAGPDLKHFDNRRMNLSLVAHGVSEAVMFDKDLNIINIADTVHGKPLLFQRGTFKPVTKTHLDVLEKGIEQLKKDAGNSEVMPMLEITLPVRAKFDVEDYLNRIEMISQLGYSCLISQFHLFYQLKHFFRRYTDKPIAIVMEASKLGRIFDESHYKNLEGGIMEGLGRLLDSQTKLLIYPHKTDKLCQTAQTFHPTAKLNHLYSHFLELKQITDISGCDETGIYNHSEDVRNLIGKKDKSWEKMVPASIIDVIKKNKDLLISK